MIFSLLVMLAAFTIGLSGIALAMLLMGIGGAPGAIIHRWGCKAESTVLRSVGFLACALGQAFIVGTYIVLVIGSLYWFSENYPQSPTWPLWIAAFFHSQAVPVYAMKERPPERTAQHNSLELVSFLASILFITILIFPETLSLIYGWIPFYDYILE